MSTTGSVRVRVGRKSVEVAFVISDHEELHNTPRGLAELIEVRISNARRLAVSRLYDKGALTWVV